MNIKDIIINMNMDTSRFPEMHTDSIQSNIKNQ